MAESETSPGGEAAVRRMRARQLAAFALYPLMEREGLQDLQVLAAGQLANAAIDAFEAAMVNPLPDSWKKYAVPISDMDGVWQVPDIQGGTPCISGSRIPTRAVWSFFRAGYTTSEIMSEYPTLTPQEIEVAIRFERARRMKPWKSP